ncbi:MAG: T9SS type A sorting domain-containing protein [Flavobacteriales bacterium]|nr:T9SS type A sorting domain-containing protein [Flavobacteriales bacterium]MBK9195858.1 T9SS type A sorting domain-containing protein [Flavobacteriales bacterium]
MRHSILLAMLLALSSARAQDELVAYEPRRAPVRTADSEEIAIIGSDSAGLYRFAVPEGTYAVDLLNAQGKRLEPQPPISNGTVDVRNMKPGTYTVRAHTFEGISIRRFSLLRRGATSWAVDP